ncbi:PREDICTED: inhibin beta E chain-like [Nipponia nippon]|uniref:inhibin beta E chain-like n=1 Tax=Nipponia nippon TaxID=128390 RepID=UPI000510CFCF|nr:PREDICTED: inhibin beta E chain-like [Nipponia nippon]
MRLEAQKPCVQQVLALGGTRAEPTSPSGLGLQFQFSRTQDQDVHILQAQLWLYLRVPRDLVASLTLRIFLAGGEGDLVGGNRTLLSERRLSAKGSGWRAFTLTPALQSFFGGERRILRLELESHGDGGDLMAIVNASRSLQPFLVAEAKVRELGHHVAKRSLRCSQNSNLCCRKDYYVDFRDIGWNDWIIKPEGYQINYCVGQCPLHVAGSPGMASSFHTAVFNLVKANNIQASGHSCCVPTRRRPISVLYFDRNRGSKLVAKQTWACLAMQMDPWEEVGGLGASPRTLGGRPGLGVAVWVAGLAPHGAQRLGGPFLAA